MKNANTKSIRFIRNIFDRGRRLSFLIRQWVFSFSPPLHKITLIEGWPTKLLSHEVRSQIYLRHL